jgi:hypothetical protein
MKISSLGNRTVLLTAIGCLVLGAYPIFASDVMTLYTPNNTEIFGYLFSELSLSEIEKKDAQYEKIIKEEGWSAEKIKASSGTYNCHGYAWHMYRGGEEIVIDGDDISQYWMDGSYRKIDKNEVVKGDIIVITDPDNPTSVHSAVVADKPGWCISKWHDGPLFLHKFDEHPFGSTFTFYRRAAPPAPQNLRIVG